MARILYVEDDPSLAFVTKDNLSRKGYNMVHCEDGETALMAFKQSNFDLILLDIMLPKLDGFSVAEQIREKDKEVPILFLTARGMEQDRLEGFVKGGDDYIVKPFSVDELALRMEVFLKRAKLSAKASKIEKIGVEGIELNLKEHLLLIEGEIKRSLTPKEAELMCYFLQNEGEALGRDQILVDLWGDNDYFNGRSLDVFISKLRKHLSEQDLYQIKTLHGLGFKFCRKED